MSKFGLVLLLLAISFTQQIELDISDLYDKFTILVKGLASSENYECSAVLVNKKTEVLKIINDLIAELKNGKKIKEIGLSYALKLLGVDGLGDKCKALDIGIKVMNLMGEQGIKDIGYKFVNQSADIIKIVTDIIDAPDLDGKLIAGGKLLKILLGISVL